MNERVQVDQKLIDEVVEHMAAKLLNRLAQKGRGSIISAHETLGILEEEFYELKMAVHGKVQSDVIEELLDIAVGAVFGIASLMQNSRAVVQAAEAERERRGVEAKKALDEKLGSAK